MNDKNFDEQNRPFLIINEIKPIKKYANSKRFFIFLLSVFFTIFAITATYLYLQSSKSTNKILISRESTINSELTKIENINDILEAEILILKNEVKKLLQNNEQKKLKKISKYLADTDITGSGVIITLKDNHSFFAPVQEENTIVHNTDLLKFVNFLWEHDATAISVNGERIAFNSNISCVGPTILVNKKRISSPFTIKAVGENLNKEEITNAAFVLSLKLRGIDTEISQEDRVTVSAGKYTAYTE